MRKFLLLIISLIIIISVFGLCVLSVSATPTSGTVGDCTWQLDGTKLIISGNGSMGDRPTAPWGLQITELVINEGVTDVPYAMFRGCTKLRRVTLASTLKIIRDSTFSGCTSLSSVQIPEGVEIIENNAFFECKLLHELKIPKTVSTIEFDSFDGCCNVSKITVDRDNPSFKSVDGVLFNKNMTEIIKYPQDKAGSSYTVPDSVTKIGCKAFDRTHNLYFVYLPDNLTSIGIGAFTFTKMRYLSQYQYNGGFYIDDYLILHESTDDKFFSVREGTKLIAGAAFASSSELTEVVIPDGVKYIGESCFSWCENLSEIYMPESIIKIDESAFDNCSSLKKVSYQGNKIDRANIVIDSYNSSLNDANWIYNPCSKFSEHEFGEWVVVKEPTANEQGLKQQKCKNCGNIIEQYIPAFSSSNDNFDKSFDVGTVVIAFCVIFAVVVIGLIVIKFKKKNSNK